MAPGTSFQPVLKDTLASDPTSVKRVVFVSGKLYYDLAKSYDATTSNVAIVRLEELAPFPRAQVLAELSRFPNADQYVWCQEETMNSGAYAFVQPRLQSLLPEGAVLNYVGRDPLAAPLLEFPRCTRPSRLL
ncbi:hypothetical protein DL89DRAFT_145545 [Linderina pennispora]|uniref:2-oxoglutarate dehydrogenase E1 component/KDG C-terminal domain-containing protein n=1 Tax=Linderina pennispora TaxID=61395 RepID=A0A1Y1VW84_9FUNG|nr:uncharacterized protein DL89DRAFT_145545 [Linderina pennispora]ORX65014.1 hypothetical protein DL89DRAFT_145545 [Linderina pennispora]